MPMSSLTRRIWPTRKSFGTSSGATPAVTPHGLDVVSEGCDPVIDVVAIHGLNGHREKTWTAKTPAGQVYWLRDLLASDLPKARILSWGYDANVYSSSGLSCVKLYDHALGLVSDLTRKRTLTNSSKRPIIFIAHSLGGIILKSALIHSDAARGGALLKQRSIKLSTYGIIFMGTPHHGGNGVQLGRLVANVASLFLEADDHILRHLEMDSEWLQQQSAQYSLIASEFVTKFAYEEYKTPTVLGRKILVCVSHSLHTSDCRLPDISKVVPKASAVVPGQANSESIVIHADHRNMVKFHSQKDPGYTTILECLVIMTRDAERVIRLRLEAESRTHNAQRNRVQSPRGRWMVPFGRREGFVGRQQILSQLLPRISPLAQEDDCQRTALDGLGGVGKTRIAIEAAFHTHHQIPDCSVFWVPAIDVTAFDNAYHEIGRLLEVPGIDEDGADVKTLVRAALSCKDSGRWLMIVDNADDLELLFGPAARLSQYLPFSRSGSILFTTRTHEAAVRLDIPQSGIISVGNMSREEATEMLQSGLTVGQTQDVQSTTSLLDFLCDLPLAIKQASAYMAETGTTTTNYLAYCQSSEKTSIDLLSREFEDLCRDKGTKNPIATTLLVSFEQISRDSPRASEYLRFLCFLAEKDIPIALLPPAKNILEADEAVAKLKAYAFITEMEDQNYFGIHRLVRLAIRSWVDGQEQAQASRTRLIQRFNQLFPELDHENLRLWVRYMPHALSVLESAEEGCSDEKARSGLLHTVAEGYYKLYHDEEAETMFRKAARLRESILGREHPDTLDSMSRLSAVLHDLWQLEEAERLLKQTLGLRLTMLGMEHPTTISEVFSLVIVLFHQGKYEEGQQICQQTLNNIRILEFVLESVRKFNKDMRSFQETLDLQNSILSIADSQILSNTANMANSESALERLDCMSQIAEYLPNLQESLAKDHVHILDMRMTKSNCLRSVFIREQGKGREPHLFLAEFKFNTSGSENEGSL
ncbi:hypothetical protein BGZ63DRAFT_395954 [Mariannaea sp. PMI_226]|nr:hypothetical protein BGZ63DRAFT_395954 [Mariannaea sp. PMI_226]